MRSFFGGKHLDTLETIAKEWEAAGRFGSRETRMARAMHWLPYYMMLCDQAEERPFDPKADPTGFIAVLTEQGILRPTDTLLDIGAGMGEYALRFAGHCKRVTALEVNPAGIALMQKRADACGVRNLETVCDLWERFEPDKTFDVTFASMCPAICNVEEILRMEQMTNRTCCLLTVLPGSYDLHRRAMMQELQLRPAGMVTDGTMYEQVLTAMGRDVRIVTKEFTSKHDVRAETVLQQFPVYFAVFGIREPDAEAFLRDYLDRNAENGVLHDESKLRYALLTWNVNG